MAKRSFFRRVGEFLRILKPKKPPVTAPQPVREPFSLKSTDAAERAARQKKLRAKRKQLEYRKRREALSVKRSVGTVEDRVERYLKMNKRDRNRFHPKDAEHRFWDLYDGRVGE